MKTSHHQQGMTLIGFVIVLIVVAIFAFMIIRLFPVYSEYYAVTRALKALTVEPGLGNASIPKIRESLDRKLYISYAKNFNAKQAKITKAPEGGYNVRAYYEVRGDLVYNLDFVATFDTAVLVSNTRATGE